MTRQNLLFFISAFMLVLAVLAIFAAATVPKGGYVDSNYEKYGTDTYEIVVDRAIDQAPELKRTALRNLVADLAILKSNVLYRLRVDPCLFPELLDCRGLESTDVKPYVEAALDKSKAEVAERQADQSRAIAEESVVISSRSFVISVFSTLIAFCSVVVAYMSYRVKR